MQKDRKYLNGNECKKILGGKEIFIFGTGIDAEDAVNTISESISIIAYVDNNRHGKGNYFHGKEIISLQQCLDRRTQNQPILVAAKRFAFEISLQLEKECLKSGEDYYVWDNLQLFHTDQATENYIRFLKETWKPYQKENTNRKILIPFDNQQDLMSVVYAYCGNFFAEKYDAAIYGFFRAGSDRSNASEIMERVYQAINMVSIIDTSLNDALQKEAEEICDSLWKGLNTWDDWDKITIYGIHFGTIMIQDFLRFYIPTFQMRDEKMYLFLRKTVQTIVFWYHYIMENDIKAVLLADGVTWEGYIRDIAVSKGIPTYLLGYKLRKATIGFCNHSYYPYLKKMWNQLTPKEQEYGIHWAKEHIEKRLMGDKEDDFPDRQNFPFLEKKTKERVLEENDKIKVMICPHIFEEDGYACGEQLFANNYFSWLCHLGELSAQTPNYDWYIKMHPYARRRDMIIMKMLLERYPQIKKLPDHVSPFQLKEEGMDFALTVYGTIGHEYPAIGIQVINAGIYNPHCSFDFNWNPKTKEEYDALIMNLPKLDKKVDMMEVYQFYSLNYLYYNPNMVSFKNLFFQNPFLAIGNQELLLNGKQPGTWRYEEYQKEWTKERHEQIWQQLEDVFQQLDEWRPDVLYKYEVKMEE